MAEEEEAMIILKMIIIRIIITIIVITTTTTTTKICDDCFNSQSNKGVWKLAHRLHSSFFES